LYFGIHSIALAVAIFYADVWDEGPSIPIHEITFSTVDRPKLLSQLSTVLSDLGLNIREAHVFSTTDGYSLDVFVVDGWPDEETDSLQEKLKAAITNSEGSLSGTWTTAILLITGDGEVDPRLLKMGDKIGCGSCGDLFRGSYLGRDVAIKVLRSDLLNETMRVEFAQELMILREVQHRNVVRFVGACTSPPQFCIVTEILQLRPYAEERRALFIAFGEDFSCRKTGLLPFQ
ncbi:hypothetical protein HPP92_027447, partial [Vanilla planifolia]